LYVNKDKVGLFNTLWRSLRPEGRRGAKEEGEIVGTPQ